MKATWLLLMLFAAVLLEQSEAQGGFMQWIEKQYDSFRKGVVRALKSLGSPSRRGTGLHRRTAIRSSNFSEPSNYIDNPPIDKTLRARSKFFNAKFQEHFLESENFPCPTGPGTSGARSPTRPTSVHELRPADIDVVAAMGDSLSAANGAAAANLVEVYIENRGMSWSIGGEATWRQYVTLPNILKEFNPNIVGYSLQDGLGAQKLSQFNVAEPLSISSDMLHQAKILVKRIRSDKRVNFTEDWKLVTIMIGGNDFCSFMCYYKNYSEMVERHKEDMDRTLDFLEANLPRTLVNLVPPPMLRVITEFKGEPAKCLPLHEVQCPCLFGLRWGHQKDYFTQLMRDFQNVETQIAESGRYSKSDDFTVVIQPFFSNANIPHKETEDGEIVTDFSFLADDCFHFSQKAQALSGNSLWNNMMEPVGKKRIRVEESLFSRFLCPTEEHPYIFTYNNSYT